MALGLISNHADGEDASQEAWLVALNRGVPPERRAAFLVGSLKRIASGSWRRRARRREHEARIQPAPEIPGADETAALREAHRLLEEALAELPEVNRQALELRFLEDRAPRVIAEIVGVSVNTVRSRVRRGIEDLRRRLDPTSLLVLLPLSDRPLSDRPLSDRPGSDRRAKENGALQVAQSAPRRFGKWALRAAVGVLLGTPVLVQWNRVASEARAERPPLTANGAPQDPGDDGPVLSTRTAERREVGSRTPGASSMKPAESSGSEEASDQVRIHGQLLLANGDPARDRSLTLEPFHVHRDPHEAMDFSFVQGWQPPVRSTDEHGNFELRFDVDPTLGVNLDFLAPGHAALRFRTHHLEPGGTLELGSIRLQREAWVRGQLVDRDGRALTHLQGETRVVATPIPEANLPGRQATERETPLAGGGLANPPRHASVDPETGSFVLTGLPAGRTSLLAHSHVLGEVQGPELELLAGQEHDATLVFDGPAPTMRIRIDVRTRPDRALPPPENIRLVGTHPEGQHPVRLAGTLGGFVFEKVPAREHSILIEDERFHPWRLDGALAGHRYEVELVGSAALILQVHDASGARIDGVRARLEKERTGYPRWARLLEEPVPENGSFTGLLPGNWRVSVQAPGYEERTLALEGLAALEQRQVRLALQRR